MNKLALLCALSLIACSDDDASLPEDGGPRADASTDAAGPDAASSNMDASIRDAGLDATADAAPQDAAAAPDGAVLDATVDATVDASVDAGCQPVVLLRGGMDPVAQGWTVVSQAPRALTQGPDYTRLETSTNQGAATSGQLLLSLANAVEAGQPLRLELVLAVESVSAHNLFDSAAAILGSFTPPSGSPTERAQMIYLDSSKIGWADDTQSAAMSVVDGLSHTYLLEVDSVGTATVSVDGVARLTRAQFVDNGTIAIGDQTNDPRVDGVMRVYSVTKLCPTP